MNVGILKVCVGESISDAKSLNLNRVSSKLNRHGYFVTMSIELTQIEKISDTFAYLTNNCDALLVCGEVDAFFDVISKSYQIDRNHTTFMFGNLMCAVSTECDDKFVEETLIPMLNAGSKTFYATVVFRTVGKTEKELRELLKDYIKNRNKIIFKFVERPPECTVLIRYSNKMQKNTVSDLLSGVTSALVAYTYAYEDIDIEQRVADMLKRYGKTLGLAESFTGGNIASRLVQFPGISQGFKEGIVCYSNEVKHNRLRVSQNILDNYGAVSVETAYEMAANLLMDGGYDYVLATTGNAGPTSEKDNEVGVCYIAVGDRKNIDIFPHKFEGDRQQVIHSGTVTALFHLYSIMSENFVRYDSRDNDEN